MPNVLHSHATGIHPGAYVQPTVPDPAPFQDGTLWIDTSSGPPHVINRWSADDAAWHAVQADVSTITGHFGYPLLPLVDGDVTRLEAWTDPVTTLDICILFVNSRPMFWAWSGTNALTGEDQFGLQLCNDKLMVDQHVQAGDILVATGGDATLAPYSQGALGTVLTITDVGGGTRLPRWGDAAGALLTPPTPPPADLTTCTGIRCGVALACTNHLQSLYAQWANWLGPFASALGTLGTGLLLTQLVDPLFDVALVGEATVATYSALRPLLATFSAAVTGGLVPALDADQLDAIQKCLFCQLTCEGGAVAVSTANAIAWHDCVNALTVFDLGTAQGALVTALLQFTPLDDWRIAASTAAASTACDAWTCP